MSVSCVSKLRVVRPCRGSVDISCQLCDPQAEGVNLRPGGNLDVLCLLDARAVIIIRIAGGLGRGFLVAGLAKDVKSFQDLVGEVLDRRGWRQIVLL